MTEIAGVERGRIEPERQRELVLGWFEDMVKYVVDVRREVVPVGGEMHADAEAALIERGSSQEDLWGANYFPGRTGGDCIEFVSLINIRPKAGNRGMLIEDAALRERVSAITYERIGTGEPLS